LAVYCPRQMTMDTQRQDKNNFLYLLKGSPVIRYYATVYWKKEEGGVQTDQEFFAKLVPWKQSLDEPIRIHLKR